VSPPRRHLRVIRHTHSYLDRTLRGLRWTGTVFKFTNSPPSWTPPAWGERGFPHLSTTHLPIHPRHHIRLAVRIPPIRFQSSFTFRPTTPVTWLGISTGRSAVVAYYDSAGRAVEVIPYPDFDAFLANHSLCTRNASFLMDLPNYILESGCRILVNNDHSRGNVRPDLSWLPMSPSPPSAPST